jgi:hypothetical protein
MKNQETSFEDLKKFIDNPYSIGANSVAFEEGFYNNGSRLIFRSGDKGRRSEIEKTLKSMGFAANKMRRNTADRAYVYRYELMLFEK